MCNFAEIRPGNSPFTLCTQGLYPTVGTNAKPRSPYIQRVPGMLRLYPLFAFLYDIIFKACVRAEYIPLSLIYRDTLWVHGYMGT